jgi:hypothetical protein
MTTTTKSKIIEPDYKERAKEIAVPLLQTVLQGACFAVGSLIVNGAASKYSARKQSQLIAGNENVLTFDKTANS